MCFTAHAFRPSLLSIKSVVMLVFWFCHHNALHLVVFYHITAALPVEQLHQRTTAVEEHVHVAVRRLPAQCWVSQAAQGEESFAEVYMGTVNQEVVGLEIVFVVYLMATFLPLLI